MERGERRSWWVVAGLVLAAGVQGFVGCAGSEGGTEAPELLTRVLAQVGPGVVLPALDGLQTRVDALRAAVVAWQGAVGTPEAEAARGAAQEAWRAVMEQWQELELMQLGPAASSASAAGGQDLRDRVYAWPSLNRCRVDQETVSGGWQEPGFFAESLVNVQGLGALEVLLFSPPDQNGCPAHTEPNASGAWAALGPDGVTAQRAGYAAAAVEAVQQVVQALREAWAPEGGDFGAQLSSAGEEGSVYADPTAALDAVYQALFYLELYTKDRKLARPLGLREDCTGAACLSEVEARLAGGSTACVAANLVGFRRLFTGGEGDGLDDLLTELGHADLSVEILAGLDEADRAAAALTSPVDVAMGSEPAAVQALHDAVKRVTDTLKGELPVVLAVQVPAEAAGDND